MPREVAYRLIRDELSLDGNPMLKYATILHIHNSGLTVDTRTASPPS